MTVRLHYLKPDGTIEDAVEDYGLESFGGFLPAAGDLILDPGVRRGADRSDPKNRTMWTVVSRVFNPRDNESYVVLIVEPHTPTAQQASLVS
ncbi:hypothetical protein HZZ16_33645 [Bradyrhizobium sp. CNPSo 4016]|nr:hypothetical protein [Bradyrhizobium glycinis]